MGFLLRGHQHWDQYLCCINPKGPSRNVLHDFVCVRGEGVKGVGLEVGRGWRGWGWKWGGVGRGGERLGGVERGGERLGGVGRGWKGWGGVTPVVIIELTYHIKPWHLPMLPQHCIPSCPVLTAVPARNYQQQSRRREDSFSLLVP